MNAFTRIPLRSDFPEPRGFGGFVAAVAGAITTAAAVVVGAVLAVFAAAAVAVLAVLGTVAVFITGMVLKNRLKKAARRRTDMGDAQVIEARKVGHAWVAYGWDQPTR